MCRSVGAVKQQTCNLGLPVVSTDVGRGVIGGKRHGMKNIFWQRNVSASVIFWRIISNSCAAHGAAALGMLCWHISKRAARAAHSLP